MKLLLVEDDLDLIQVVDKILKINGYIVDCANDGLEALDYLKVNTYDLVIMDVMMPKMDGITALKRIRADKNSVPVLLLTAKAMTDDKIEGLDSGADDYLTKPFQMRELLARIRALTRRQTPISFMQLGNITLNPNTYEMKANKSVSLTNKEFKIMDFLMRNTDAFMSSEKIMDSIYDISSEAEIGVIWVFVSGLRKKLEMIGADYTIKTKKGIGYRLEKIEEDD